MNTFNSGGFSNLLRTSFVQPPATGSSKINVGTTERILSAAGGLLLSYWSIKKKGITGTILATAGTSLLYRAMSGYCPLNKAIDRDTAGDVNEPVEITSRLTINKPKEMLYRYWRKLENLPNFMDHLEEVNQTGNNISLWVAKIPGGIGDVEWEAKVTKEEENHLIAWQSLPESEIDNAGEVRFENAPNGQGTIVETTISYRPPAGDVGEYAAKLLNPAFKKIVQKDLERFKNFMESGDYENETFPGWEDTGSM